MSNQPVPPNPRPKGRHRAAPPPDDPSNLSFDEIIHPTQQIPLAPASRRERRDQERAADARKKQQRKSAALATGSFAVVTGVGGVLGLQSVSIPAVDLRTSQVPVVAASAQGMVLAGDASLVFEGPKVSTVAAPPPDPKPAPAPVVKMEAAKPVAVPLVGPQPAPVTAPASGKGAAIAEAALAQLGETQDCVKMVSDALATVGVKWYDWPIGALRLGTQVPLSQAQRGDVLYYVNGAGTSVAGMAHVAIYIGDGKAVHGGFNGSQTVVWSWNVGYAPAVPPTAVIRVA
ncbi:NlpC/P60 family protein [Paenarthrobacter sp. YJN-5]|uniref:NlpC/P60 family protein n=1 Tax=Paenarthrobacter sp. YJN-5 TaxID=2735316 RepID=UPI001878172D|nr:NlpC/P60 family protein [Paenarthrobacter sp. YJN-5]QOT19725.1 hypothetical protein HMI59_23990 [Paenarthrobacter sp. YJN-5]